MWALIGHKYGEGLKEEEGQLRQESTQLLIPFSLPPPLQVRFENGSSQYGASSLRKDPTFVYWYTHSFIIHPFLTTTIVPILVLCIMNAFIYK